MDVTNIQGTTAIETTDLQGREVSVAWITDDPNYRTSQRYKLEPLTEMRVFIGFMEPNGEPGDGYVTWLPVFVEWWDDGLFPF